MLRSDNEAAYPIVAGIPVLLGPEGLTHPDRAGDEDLHVPVYAEAYEEMAHYNSVARGHGEDLSASPQWKLFIDRLQVAERSTFPSRARNGSTPPTTASPSATPTGSWHRRSKPVG